MNVSPNFVPFPEDLYEPIRPYMQAASNCQETGTVMRDANINMTEDRPATCGEVANIGDLTERQVILCPEHARNAWSLLTITGLMKAEIAYWQQVTPPNRVTTALAIYENGEAHNQCVSERSQSIRMTLPVNNKVKLNDEAFEAITIIEPKTFTVHRMCRKEQRYCAHYLTAESGEDLTESQLNHVQDSMLKFSCELRRCQLPHIVFPMPDIAGDEAAAEAAAAPPVEQVEEEVEADMQ